MCSLHPLHQSFSAKDPKQRELNVKPQKKWDVEGLSWPWNRGRLLYLQTGLISLQANFKPGTAEIYGSLQAPKCCM